MYHDREEGRRDATRTRTEEKQSRRAVGIHARGGLDRAHLRHGRKSQEYLSSQRPGQDRSPPGNLIYHPPSNFCDYFTCVASFWGADDPGDGYVVQCSDGMYSQAGGEPEACSSHGGVYRPLYSH